MAKATSKAGEGGGGGGGVDVDLSQSLITLVSEEGETFKISRAAAMRSGTIRSMLSGDFTESGTSIVPLQIRSPVLEKVIEYLEWAHKYTGVSEGTRVPDFEKQIPPELALELLMTADFLDV